MASAGAVPVFGGIMRALFLSLGLLLCWFPTSNADVLIEPLAGYNFGVKQDTKNGSNFHGGSGGGYGGRVGFTKLGFQIGLDYLNSNIRMSSKKFSDRVRSEDFGAFAGFQFPGFFRLYGGYIFSSTADTSYKVDNGAKTHYTDGMGAKAGVGLTFFPFLALNLEYRHVSYDKSELMSVKSTNSTTVSNWLVSISIPLTI